jgi:transcriptional regulator with XRE-family HTH domain
MDKKSMNSGKALDFVINHFDLQAKELADLSGVAAETISRYRNNARDIKADNLINILKAMPSDARHMFISLVADEIQSVPLPNAA